MGIEPHNKQDRLGALLLRRRNDETLAALLPLLEEVAALPDDELLSQKIHNILNLRKENAKLRGLAVKLSNLLALDIHADNMTTVARLPLRFGA